MVNPLLTALGLIWAYSGQNARCRNPVVPAAKRFAQYARARAEGAIERAGLFCSAKMSLMALNVGSPRRSAMSGVGSTAEVTDAHLRWRSWRVEDEDGDRGCGAACSVGRHSPRARWEKPRSGNASFATLSAKMRRTKSAPNSTASTDAARAPFQASISPQRPVPEWSAMRALRKSSLAMQHLTKAKQIFSQLGQTPNLALVNAALTELG
jgi:hypothetical protein